MSAQPQRRRILVVEDDEAVRTLVAKALGTIYEVVQAADGLEASRLLGQKNAFDLLVCDVMMPHVDGFSLIRVLRAQSGAGAIPPVIFLTAKSDPQDLVKGIQLGAKHYMQKPFKIKDLLDRVARLLPERLA